MVVTISWVAVVGYLLVHRQVVANYHPTLTYTRWVADQNVTSGPEPGYRPDFTGLTGRDISAAKANLDSTGTAWVIDMTFTPRGSELFSSLTRANVAACPGDPNTQATANCAQRHLTIWLDLTQADVDKWEDAGYVAEVSGAYDIQCLARKATAMICPKFVTDPITLEQVDGGQAEISGAFSEQSAKSLASAINSRAR